MIDGGNMLFKIKRMLLIVMIIVITFCCVEVKAYFSFDKNASVNFAMLSYSNLTIATDKTVYGTCNNVPTMTLTITNPNNYNVIYTLSFSDSNLTYEIDGASGATYTVNAVSSKTHTIVLSGTTTSTSLTVTVNATLPYKSSHTKTVTLDISCPSSSITSSNNVATSQTATLTCSDTEGMSSYYWGTKSAPSASEYTSQTSNLSTTKTVNAAGTYYLICKDKNENTTSTNKTYYKTTLTMNKGTVSPASVITMSGNSFTLPTPTASTGYTNKGAWYTSTAYSTSAGNYGASYKPTASGTLYSTATANTYSIGYTLNGGTNGTNKPASGTYDSLVTLSNPTKTFTVNITNNVSGATVANNATSASSTQTFAGWTSTTVGSNAKTGTTTSPATAWTGSSTKNTYFKNLRESGTVTMIANWTAVAVTLPTVTKTGHTCGYTTSSTGTSIVHKSGASYTPSTTTASATLYVVCTANTYTVEYYTYDGGTKLGSSSHTYGTSKELTTMETLGGSAPNTSVTFYGWATSANGTSRSYTDGQSVTSLTATNGGTVKIYAIYSKTVTVTFNANGCTTAAGSATGTIYNAGTTVSVTVPTATLNTTWKNLKASTSSTADTASSGTAVGSALSISVGSTSKTATAYYICNKTVTVTFNANNCTTASKTATFVVKNGGTSGSVTVPNADMNSGWTTLGASSSASSTSQGTAMGSSMSISIGTSSSGTNRYYNCIKAAVTKSVTYSKGANVSAIGSTSGSCQVAAVYNGATQGTSCTVTLPSITANTGYTSVGWSTTNVATSGTAAGNSYTLSAASTTLYANAKVNTYTVEYYTYNGGTKLGSSSHTYGTAKALTTMATLGGSAPNTSVTFYGWATSANSTSRSYTDGQSVTSLTSTNGGVVKLYAIYRSAGVVITYKSGVNSATSTTSSTYYYYNASTSVSITTGTPAAITSWNTQGWRDDTSVGSIEYSSATAYNFSASKTLYGIYSRSYAATFYSGVSKGTSKALSSSTATYNSNTASLPTTVSITLDTQANSADIANWSELGWRDDTTAGAKEYSYGGTVTVAWGTNFYSVYSRTLTISYNSNGGTSGSTSNTTATIYLNSNSTTTSSQAVSLRANGFSKTGHTFSNWAAGSTSGTQYAAGASYTAGVAYNASTFGTTMYAIWTVNSYTVTYDCETNGGSGNATASVNYNSSVSLSKTCTAPSGWTFVGWHTSSTATSKLSSYTMPANSLTLYAVYSKTVTVTFNANGCTTAAKTATMTLYNGGTSGSVTVPSADMNSGWTTLGASSSASSTSSGTAMGSAMSFTGIGSSTTTATRYYNCSKAVTVTFNANGCATANGSASTTIYNGATTASVTVPTPTMNTNWTNLGGSTSSTATSGTASGSALSVSVASANKTATAYFICSKTFTATFNANSCTTAAKTASGTLYNGGTSISLTVPSATMNSGWTSLGASSSASSTSSGTAMGSAMSFTSIGSSTTTATRYYNCSKAAITRNVTYSKGANVSAIGATSGSCTIAAVYNGASQSTSCTVTLPTITANTGYTAVGWSTTNGATSGTAAGSSYTLSSASTTLYANATDQTKPSCSFGDWSVSSINVDETATITVTCTDTGSGVSTTSLTSSSFTVSDISALSISTVTTTSVTNGKSYTITVTGLNKTASPTITLKASQVSDVAGNGNNAVTSASISIVADTSGPDIEFNANSNLTAAKSQSSAVTVTDHSNITTIKYLWTQTAGASASSGTSFSTVNVKTVTETKSKSSDNGTWYLCVYAVDSRGNSTNKCSGAFVLDNASPNCTIANPICLIKGATFNAANYISCTDASTVTLSTSGTVTTSTPGSYSVTVTAKDSAGNSASKSTTVYVYTKLTSDTVASGDGLYKDSYTSNRYLYRGTSPSNYVTFNGSNNWRIVAVNPDGTYKLAYMTSLGNKQFHSSKTTSFSGSTLETYLSGTYYSSLNSTAQSYIVSSGYYYNGAFGAASSSNAMSTNVATDRASAYTGKVALLSASDYILASTHASCTNYYYAYNKVSNVVPCSTNNYLFKSSGSHWWIMNGHTNGNSRLIGTDGNLKNLGATNSYAVYPVVTLKATTTFLGSGTSSNPYTICTSCLETGISTTTCSISASAYGTTNTLTINPSSTSGITYSWDNGVTYSSTKTKTVSAAGAYTAYIKDSTGKVNTCSITIKSRTEYLSRSCTGTKTYGSWSSGSTTYNSVSCSGYTGDYSRVVCGNTYVAKWRCDVISGFCYDESTGGTSSAQSSWTNCNNWCNGQQSAMAAPISCTCYPSRTYQTRTCSCSAWGAWDTTWSTTEIESSCSKEVQTRTTYGV